MWQPMQERCYINLIPWPRSRMRRLQHVYTVRFKWSENAQIMRFLRVRILILIKKIKKIKKMLAFCWNMLYSIFCWRVNEMRTMRSVGQAAKTSPSHGENRGSIPLQTAMFFVKQLNPLKEPVRIQVLLICYKLFWKGFCVLRQLY